MKAFVLIKIHAGEVREVVRQLRKTEMVTEAHMTFGPFDAVAVMDSAELADIGRQIANTIQTIPGVEQTLTCLAVDV